MDFLESAFDTSCTYIWTNQSTLVSFLKVSVLISGQRVGVVLTCSFSGYRKLLLHCAAL